MTITRWLVVALALVAAPALAQSSSFALSWNQSDVAPAVITSGTYAYKLQIDTAPPIALTPTCVVAVAPALGSQCTAPLPTLAPGPHTLTLSVSNAFGTTTSDPLTGGPPAKPLKFQVVVTVTVGFTP